ncbi:PHD finger protein 20-like protein 1 isoform X4 [Osmerus eperlanus]|uniref:PHD finger protein 20-like protein 1 isoform X4 n=1 Tax=Osmerus eperlanus TaxID=29151 RepID=UPI002E0F4D13
MGWWLVHWNAPYLGLGRIKYLREQKNGKAVFNTLAICIFLLSNVLAKTQNISLGIDSLKMSKKPPNRPGISFEVGARVEAQDYLKKWYPSRIEEVDFEEGKMLVHFDRWSHRYDEWILWDSTRLRPLERSALRKEGLKEDEEMTELRDGEEVLARWTDCRYYPAKIESFNKDTGTYTVQFYDGVVRCVKRIHIKSMPEDAKGQDWVALVKAASAAARNRGNSKPRTSANSNKDRDEGRGEPSEDEDAEDDFDDDEQEEEESNSDKPGACVDSAGDQEEQRDEEDSRHPPVSSPAPAKGGARRSNHQSVESTSSTPSQPVSAPSSAGEETQPGTEPPLPPSLSSSTAPSLPAPSSPSPSLRTSESAQQRRRSQRLATTPVDAPGDPTPNPAHADNSPSSPAKETRPTEIGASSTEGAVLNCVEKSDSSLHNYCAGMPPAPTPPAPATGQNQLPGGPPANHAGEKSSPLAAVPCLPAPGLKTATIRTPKMNKHTREPIMSTLRSEDPSSPGDLDSQFQCQVAGCSKAFRKAKLLEYHLKYYHNAERETHDFETGSPDRVGRTRATSTSLPPSSNSQLEVPDSKRRRTVSSSSSLSPQAQALQLDCVRAGRSGRKKRSSASMSSDSTEVSLPPLPRDRSLDNLHEKILKKVIDKDKYPETGFIKTEKKVKLEEKPQQLGKKKEKDRERRDRKDKDLFKLKQKKKKKKKKKSKQHSYTDFDGMSLSFLDRSSSPLHRSSGSAFTFLTSSSPSSSKHHQYPRAILSVDLTGENLSDVDYLEDSTTESLLLSGDDLSQEDLAMEAFPPEEPQDSQEIVRCVCQMDEENGFMIQCEECMCWQHSVCMGLLEDSIPEQYICYICRDPPGQRWSAKYLHDRDWLTKGHMLGLSFLSDNYSHQNCQKIVSTHQLLADAYSLKTLLHGLTLKMDILQNRHSPSLHFWARSWVNSDEDQPMGGLPDCLHFQEVLADSEDQNCLPDTYITSEHSYQKPPGTPGAATDPPRMAADLLGCSREEGEVGMSLELKTVTHSVEQGERAAVMLPGADSVEHARNCLQWQMNLLTHIEDVQNQLASRMDLIEKELDVLESWLDLSGELEPPDPLARLPQLKLRIKQLLSDLSKVQQMSALCSV